MVDILTIKGVEARGNFVGNKIKFLQDQNPNYNKYVLLLNKWSLMLSVVGDEIPFDVATKLKFIDLAAIMAIKKYNLQKQEEAANRQRMESSKNGA